MARQNINIGTAANDGTGDKLRVAFDKVNDNFIELYELGDKGSKGDVGAQGIQGTTGSTGAQGVQGAQGQKGEPSVGGSGAQGEQGVQGAQGVQGETGVAGSKGDKGDIGAQGEQGFQGVQGDVGTSGSKGDRGEQGENGAQGSQGVQGGSGVKGDQGDIGTQGVQGSTGSKGEPGSGASLPIANGSSNIDIANTNSDVTVTANGYTWNFNETGRLYLPLDLSGQSAITFATNPGGGSFDQADIQFYAVSGEDTVLEIKNRNDTQDSIKLNASGPIRVVTDGDGNIGGPYSWEFATNGSIIFPDSTVQNTAFTGAGAQGAQGVQGAAGSIGAQGVQGAAGGGGSLPLANGNSNFDIASSNGDATITVDGSSTWTFDNAGDLTVPNYIRFDGNTFIGDEPGAGPPMFRIDAPLGYAIQLTTDGDISGNNWAWKFGENGSLDLPGNITNFTACSAINFVANSSGDGNGYTTIEIRPDSNATNDNYLIIDPTSPNHIHIRAGGSQDNSNAEIYLGGENSYFKVDNGSNPAASIASNGYTWLFNTDGTFTFSDSTVQTTAYAGTDIITTKKVYETTSALSTATGVVTHDCDNGHIFVHSSISANFTANFTNTTIAPNTATAFTLVLNQGATAYVANAVQIGGVAQTVNWQGSSTVPGGNANKKDVISFSVVNNDGTWITLGQLTSFG